MLKKNEYIEFDIELAKQGGCKICTRDGAKVKILTLEAVNYKPIVALVTRYNGTEDVVSYWKSGRLGDRKNGDDLVILREKPQKTFVGYANLYKNGQLGEVFATEKEAKDCLFNRENYVATIKIEY